jgi:hypothetical protein
MHAEEQGRALLDQLMIERFTAPREEWYQPVREMAALISNPPPNPNHAPQDP